MGLIVYNYITEQGFVVPELYIQLTCIRILKALGGNNYGMVYTSLAYKSLVEKNSGASPIPIPNYLANVEGFLVADQFYEQTIFGFAYDAIKATWQNAGYTVADFYPHPPTPTTYIYDCSGYNFHGYNSAGFNKDGYNKFGLNSAGWDREGYDVNGLDKEGYDRQGYDKDSYNKAGFDRFGFDREGYDVDGYDADGYNRDGVNRNGESRPSA